MRERATDVTIYFAEKRLIFSMTDISTKMAEAGIESIEEVTEAADKKQFRFLILGHPFLCA